MARLFFFLCRMQGWAIISTGLILCSIMLTHRAVPEPDGRCCQRVVELPGGGQKIVCDMPGLGCVCDKQDGD